MRTPKPMPLDELPGKYPAKHAPPPKDASQLLKAGAWLLLTGLAATLLIETVFGGIRQHGPHTNGGWLLLMVAMSCLPLGAMLLLLGGAKWLSRRSADR
jgi:hypothetical protein